MTDKPEVQDHPTDDAFESSWREYNANGNAGGWERIAFISGFGKGWKSAIAAHAPRRSEAQQDSSECCQAKFGRHCGGECTCQICAPDLHEREGEAPRPQSDSEKSPIDDHWKMRLEKVLPMLTELKKTARLCGYALLEHGSMSRDIDLVAVPWAEEAVSAEQLAESIRTRAAELNNAKVAFLAPHEAKDFPKKKPHGRLCWAFHLGGGPYLDLSVLPTEAGVPPTQDELKAAHDEGILFEAYVLIAGLYRGTTWEIAPAIKKEMAKWLDLYANSGEAKGE